MHARPPQPVGGPAPPPGSLGGLPTPATQPPHYSQHYAGQYQQQQHQQQPRALNGTAMPGQMIGPSHPSHPQHAAWIAHHHHQQQLAAAQGLPNPPPHLQGPPAGAGSSTRMAHAAANGGSAAPYGSTFVQIPPPPSPVGASPRMPPGQVQPLGGGMQGGMRPLSSQQQLQQQQQQQQPHGQYQHGQHHIAPPARSIPSAAGIRPLSSLATSPPHAAANHHNPNASPFPQYAISASNSQSPALGHRQSISGGPLPPPPPPSFVGHPQQPAGPRQHLVRQSLAPQPNTLLAAHVAVNGTGPITATSAPSGPALSRLAALNEALQLALESDSPLDALRIAVADHFTDTGVVKIGLFDSATPMSKVFEIPCSAFPRFQHINHLLGAISSMFQPCLVREFRLTTPDPSNPPPPPPRPASPLVGGPPPPPNASFPAVHIGYLLRSEDAIWSSRFHDGARVDLRGALTLHLMFKDLGNGAAGLRIESLEFDARGFEESVPRSVLAKLEQALSAAMAVATSAKTALKAAAATAASTADDKVTAKDEETENNANGSSRRRGASAKAQQQARGMNTRRRSAATKAELVNDDALPPVEGGSGAVAAAQDSKTPSASSSSTTTTTAGATAAGTASENKAQDGDAIEALRDRVAPSPVGAFGVTEMGMRCLEIAESVAQLQNLIAFSLESGFGPIDALSRYADMHRSGVFASPSDRGLAAAAAAAAASSSAAGPGGGEGMYNGPGPVQQAFAAHPGLGGDIGGTSIGPGPEMVSLKRGAPPPLSMPNSAAIEMLDRDLPSPQKVPRVTAGRGRGRWR